MSPESKEDFDYRHYASSGSEWGSVFVVAIISLVGVGTVLLATHIWQTWWGFY